MRNTVYLATLILALVALSSLVSNDAVLPQTPSQILEQELTGRLVFEDWNEIVEWYSKPGRITKFWIYIDGRIVRKLPFDRRDQQRSDTILLPPGNYKLEVLGLEGPPPLSHIRTSRLGTIYVKNVSVKAGATVRDSMVRALLLYRSPSKASRSIDFIRENFLGPDPPRFPRIPRIIWVETDNDVKKFGRRVEEALKMLKESPLVLALLAAADWLDQQSPVTRRVVVSFPEDMGGPREVDADLVRAAFHTTIGALGVGGYMLVGSDAAVRAAEPYSKLYNQEEEFIERRIMGIAEKLERVPQ